MQSKNFQKSLIVPKKMRVKKTKIAKGILSIFYVFEVLNVGFVSFCFGRGSSVWNLSSSSC